MAEPKLPRKLERVAVQEMIVAVVNLANVLKNPLLVLVRAMTLRHVNVILAALVLLPKPRNKLSLVRERPVAPVENPPVVAKKENVNVLVNVVLKILNHATAKMIVLVKLNPKREWVVFAP